MGGCVAGRDWTCDEDEGGELNGRQDSSANTDRPTTQAGSAAGHGTGRLARWTRSEVESCARRPTAPH